MSSDMEDTTQQQQPIGAGTVEAALDALSEDSLVTWDDMQKALAAAAPYMLSAAWNEFMKGKWDPLQENPYKRGLDRV